MAIIKNIVVWAVTTCLGYLIVQICLARIYTESKPDRALFAFPSYSEALIVQNYGILETVNAEKISSIKRNLIIENIAKILRRAPLNDDALLQAVLLDHFEKGEYVKPELLIMAKGRNARNRNTLRHLLRFYVLSGKYRAAATELDLLLRLDPKNSDNYFEVLGSLYETQSGKTAINDKLKTKRVWSHRFLERAIKDATFEQILTLSDPIKYQVKAGKSSKNSLALAEKYFRKLVSIGQTEYAYAFWKIFYSERVGVIDPEMGVMFNPLFQDIAVPSPFNWRIHNHAAISTEYDIGGGLFVSFNHTKPRLIAWQHAKVSADIPLEINFSASLNYGEQQGDFEWRIICLKTRQKIAILSTLNLMQKSDDALIEFPSSEGERCHFIDVQLWGMPGVFNSRVSMTIEKFDITPMERE